MWRTERAGGDKGVEKQVTQILRREPKVKDYLCFPRRAVGRSLGLVHMHGGSDVCVTCALPEGKRWHQRTLLATILSTT